MSELKVAVAADYQNIVPARTYVGNLRKLGFETSWVTRPTALEMLREAAHASRDSTDERHNPSYINGLSNLLQYPSYQSARLNVLEDADCVLVVNKNHLSLPQERHKIKNNLSLQSIITLAQAAALGAATMLSDNFPFHTGEKRSPNAELDVILHSMGVRALNGSMEALPTIYEEHQGANYPGESV